MMRAQDGDGRAYGSLMHAISPYLRHLARRTGLMPGDVEDAVQDVLLTIHTVRHTYDPARPFAPWLVAIARNRFIDRLRRLSRLARRETGLSEAHETVAAAETNHVERDSEARRLHAAIQELPPAQRQAIEMTRLQELSLKEASAKSGQSETAIKVSVHRAVKRLRRILGGDAS
jgi:RNA polymerase sigma-70 factor (ECF subfamily)